MADETGEGLKGLPSNVEIAHTSFQGKASSGIFGSEGEHPCEKSGLRLSAHLPEIPAKVMD